MTSPASQKAQTSQPHRPTYGQEDIRHSTKPNCLYFVWCLCAFFTVLSQGRSEANVKLTRSVSCVVESSSDEATCFRKRQIFEMSRRSTRQGTYHGKRHLLLVEKRRAGLPQRNAAVNLKPPLPPTPRLWLEKAFVTHAIGHTHTRPLKINNVHTTTTAPQP